MTEAIYVAGFYICFVWAIKQHFSMRSLRRDMDAAEEKIMRYQIAVDEIDKWCGHESAEARLIAAFISASGEGRGMNAGTPRENEVCDISGTRDQLRRLKHRVQTDTQSAEPYAVLVREIGETSFFDHRPVRPGTEQHLAAMRNPELDYVELYSSAQGERADSRDVIRELIGKHRAELEHNHYAYFELAYTRRTGWMAWITDKPLNSGPVINPDRKVLCSGQGDTPEEACSAAIEAAKGE